MSKCRVSRVINALGVQNCYVTRQTGAAISAIMGLCLRELLFNPLAKARRVEMLRKRRSEGAPPLRFETKLQRIEADRGDDFRYNGIVLVRFALFSVERRRLSSEMQRFEPRRFEAKLQRYETDRRRAFCYNGTVLKRVSGN